MDTFPYKLSQPVILHNIYYQLCLNNQYVCNNKISCQIGDVFTVWAWLLMEVGLWMVTIDTYLCD